MSPEVRTIDNIKSECRTKATNAEVFIAIFRGWSKPLAFGLRAIKALSLLVPVVLALAVMSAHFKPDDIEKFTWWAVIASGFQVLLSILAYGFDWDSKLANYQLLIRKLIGHRQDFRHMNAMEATNAGHLTYSYGIASAKHNATLEDVEPLISKSDFDAKAKEMHLAPPTVAAVH